MKKQFMFSLAALILSASAFGQVENDDMYFNSKDRAKLKAERASQESLVIASASTRKSKKADPITEEVNPTDSYSARNVNPEFAARSNSQSAAADNQDYYVNNYQKATSNNLNNWNNNFNDWYSNPWYCNGYYGSGMYGYNPYYTTFGTPWYNPYYGWTTGIGLAFGYGYGNPYMNSWYGYPGMAYGFGYGSYGYGGYGRYGYGGWGYGGGGYPGTIVVVNNGGENGRKVVYGKRGSHGGMVTVPDGNTRSRTSYATTYSRPTNTSTNTGGRVATSGRSQTQAEYYNRSWRNSQQNSYPSNTRSSSFDSWDGDTNSRYGSGSYSSPSRSNSSFNGGGGSGTRSSAPASSGSNGRTRGRD